MLSFFKKIRYRLLGENNTGKYVRYALGEIILVMIGILLALQVNNWNEKKKLENKLETIYNIISKDLEGNIAEVKETLDFYKSREPYIKHVLDGEITKEDYADSTYFSLITYAPRVSVTTRGFNLLVASSDDGAAEDSLQISITEFYSLTISRVEFLKDYVISDIEDNFSHWKSNFEWYPNYIRRRDTDNFIDYTLTNPDYKNRVANYYFVHYTVAIRYLEEFLNNADHLLKIIENRNE